MKSRTKRTGAHSARATRRKTETRSRDPIVFAPVRQERASVAAERISPGWIKVAGPGADSPRVTPLRAALVSSVTLLALLGGCSVLAGTDEGDWTTGSAPLPVYVTPAPPPPAAPEVPEPAAAVPEPEFPWCQGALLTEVPAGASEAAVAYLAAVNAATPAWQAVDDRIVGSGFRVDSDDLVAQADADEPFILTLEEIDFPDEVDPLAAELIHALLDYREFLQATLTTAFQDPTYGAQTMALQERRSAASGALREALGIPPSTCAYHRP